MTTPTNTTFVPGTTITSAWLNGVNDSIFDMYGETQYNLYVSVTGSDSNDGLTVSTPFATLQKAFDTLMAIGNVGGRRTINIAAGTYDTVSNYTALLGPANEDEVDPNTDTYLQDNVNAVNYILIQGPDVGYDPATDPWPTPTAIFDANGSAAVGIRIEGPIKVLIKNIKFVDYSGSSSSSGISGDGAYLRCENVHTSGCTYGIQSQNGKLEVRGGDFYGTAGKVGTGIRSLFVNYHSIGNQAALGAGEGPRFRYLGVAALAQEGSTGHCDSATIEDCVYGLQATVNARFNYSYTDFKRCTRAVRCEAGAVVFGSSTAEFHTNTADANTENISITSGGVDVDRDLYANGVFAKEYMDAPVTHTGSTTNLTLLQKDIGQGEFCPSLSSIRSPQHIEGFVFGKFNAALVDNVQFKLRLANAPGTGGTSAGLTVDAASVTASRDFVYRFSCVFTSYNTQYLSFDGGSNLYPTYPVDVATATEDLHAAAKTLTLEIQLLNAADSVTIYHAHFKTVG